MKPSDVLDVMKSLVPTRRPVFLHGKPGVGKSTLVARAAKEMGLQFTVARLPLFDAVDINGLPTVKDGRVEWARPSFIPTEGEGILFLDELPQAAPLVQAASLKLLDREDFPAGWSIVAAGNRQEDRAGTHRLITPLLNRFVHLDVDVDNEDWQGWASAKGVVAETRSFLRYRPGLLSQFDASSNQRAFPSPRSWECVSDVFPVIPEGMRHAVFSGCVGEGPAAEFLSYLPFYYAGLDNLDAILKGPKTAQVPKEPAVLYALSGALVEKCRGDAQHAEAVTVYATRMPEEFAMLTLRDMLAVNPKLVTSPVVNKWVADARKKGMFAF